jgi:hypothetical protein
MLAAAASLALWAAAVVLWVRSYHTSDWVARIDLDGNGRTTELGAATIRGTFGVYWGRAWIAGTSAPAQTIHQYNSQRVDRVMMLPLRRNARQVAGFGWYSLYNQPTAMGSYSRHSEIQVPGWFVVGILGIPTVLLVRRVVLARRNRRLNLCPCCGYDLRATPDRCPECGTETTAKNRTV